MEENMVDKIIETASAWLDEDSCDIDAFRRPFIFHL
jgi:hypothetical protein